MNAMKTRKQHEWRKSGNNENPNINAEICGMRVLRICSQFLYREMIKKKKKRKMVVEDGVRRKRK